MSNKLIPDINACIGAGIEALVEKRPKALDFINYGTGRYSHLFEGWKAQGNIVAQRFASEAKATRLFDEGVALRQLSASEFDVSLSIDPTFSIGEVGLFRYNPLGVYPAGVIRKGQLLSREGDEDKQPLKIPGARYEVAHDVVVLKDQLSVTVPIVAQKSGSTGSTIEYLAGEVILPYHTLKFSTSLFDTNFGITSVRVAGGSQNPASDRNVRRASTAYAQGRFAPTEGAIIAGTLLYSGISNLAVIENESNARTVVFPVDEAWGWSQTLNNAVGQFLKDNFCGFGCAIQTGKVYNQFIHVDASVRLFNGKDLIDTTSLLTSIKAALTSYFNDRPDWWTWKTSAVKSVITGADRKIYSCVSLTMKDAITGAVITEPEALSLTLADTDPYLPHFYLADNTVNIEFLGPA